MAFDAEFNVTFVPYILEMVTDYEHNRPVLIGVVADRFSYIDVKVLCVGPNRCKITQLEAIVDFLHFESDLPSDGCNLFLRLLFDSSIQDDLLETTLQ